MNYEPTMEHHYHGLVGTLLSIGLFILGKLFCLLSFLSVQIAGTELHDLLSNASLAAALIVATFTAINNAERALDNVIKWKNYWIDKFKKW